MDKKENRNKLKEVSRVSINQSTSSDYSEEECLNNGSVFKSTKKHITKSLPSTHHKKRKNYQIKKKKEAVTPPNKYSTLSIFPTNEDINGELPFLRQNVVEGEYENCEHYLDVQFRLFREDCISPLREGIKEYKERIKECDERFMGMYELSDVKKKLKLTYIYEDVKITIPQLDDMFGLIHTLTFKPLPPSYIWKGSSRLQEGTLLCLSSDEFVDSFIFATVTYRTDDVSEGKIKVCFEEHQNDILFEIPVSQTYSMLEMRSAYFESYRHTLSVLKELNEDNFPMKQYIVKSKQTVEPPCYLNENALYDFGPILKRENSQNREMCECVEVPILELEKWPTREEVGLDFTQYSVLKAALTKEFCIIQGPPGTGKTFMGLKIVKMLLHNRNIWYPSDIEHECPILIACYTNHALDQFLEKILEFTDKIVRVGDQSESEILEDFKLKNLRCSAKVDSFLSSYHCSRKRLKWKQGTIKNQINSYNFVMEAASYIILKPKILRNFMKEEHYKSLKSHYKISTSKIRSILELWLEVPLNDALDDTFSQANSYSRSNFDTDMNDMDIEEICSWMKWEPCNNKQQSHYGWNKPAYEKHKEYIKKYLNNTDIMTTEEAEDIGDGDIHLLQVHDKWRLYRLWVAKFITFIANTINVLEEEFNTVTRELRETKWQKDVAIVQHSDIIGVTCTGTAKFHCLIEAIAPQIVIIEEAAEVLEAHLISSLPKSVKHVILIGDHKQLRPLPSVHELAVKQKLDVSLFERMVRNKVDYTTLVSQHRMRPCIADLLVGPIYDELSHHESVYHYDDIVGLQNNMHFISHISLEEKLESSYSNLQEAKMVVRLSRYLLLQGYEPSQITILSTYSGQVKAIRNEAKNIEQENKNINVTPKDIKVTTVDNYQGEENDIIIVSFVRSNYEGNIGFLKTANRVCVALSRARKGLFCFGNFDFLASESELWEHIVDKLKRENAIDPSLVLVCQNHSFGTSIEYPSDFKKVFDGGCTQVCCALLKCGHMCKRYCHATDREHRLYICEEKCTEQCEHKHPCEKMCFEECGKCTKLRFAQLPKCGHKSPVPCYVDDLSIYKCKQNCNKILKCGHKCTKLCYEDCEPCMRKVPKTLPCKHTVVIECFEKDIKCLQKCNIPFPCGHACPKKCGEQCPKICESNVAIHLPCDHVATLPCFKRNERITCTTSCKAILPCGHRCPGDCSKCQSEKHVECWYTCGKPVNGVGTCKLRCGHKNKCNPRFIVHKTSSPNFGNSSKPVFSKSAYGDKHMVNKWKTGYEDADEY